MGSFVCYKCTRSWYENARDERWTFKKKKKATWV